MPRACPPPPAPLRACPTCSPAQVRAHGAVGLQTQLSPDRRVRRRCRGLLSQGAGLVLEWLSRAAHRSGCGSLVGLLSQHTLARGCVALWGSAFLTSLALELQKRFCWGCFWGSPSPTATALFW